MSNKKFVLPYGDPLKDFLTDACVSKGELKKILRNRGVFTCDDDKSTTIPAILRTGIAPHELSDLYNNVKEKEDERKSITQSIKCNAKDFDLLSVVPSDGEIREVLRQPFLNYEIVGVPSFRIQDSNPNIVQLDFTIERTDHTASWDKNTKQFSGSVRFSKDKGELDIDISLSHTSPETKDVASKISKDMVNRLKEGGYVSKEEQITKIRFNDFTNASRVKFLNSLSKDHIQNELYFKDTRDIGFCPDDSLELPEDISWMQEKIHNLVLQGKDLHSTFFVRNSDYHEFIKMYKVEASYTFDYSDCSGTCYVSFEFPELLSKQDQSSELLIKVQNIRFKESEKKVAAGLIKERTLRVLEKVKLKLHEKLSKDGEMLDV